VLSLSHVTDPRLPHVLETPPHRDCPRHGRVTGYCLSDRCPCCGLEFLPDLNDLRERVIAQQRMNDQKL
jgi:hypothetical protein